MYLNCKEGMIVKMENITANNKLYDIHNNLLRSSKDPRINIENVKNMIMKKMNFINMDKLRIYEFTAGCYRALSRDNTLIEINKYIPNNIRSFIEPSDLRKLYEAIRLEPSIQFNPELVPDNKYLINCHNGVLDFNTLSNGKPIIMYHNEIYRFINCVQANYNPNYSINNFYFERFIVNITKGDNQLIILIQEILGYIFSNFNNAKKAFILFGESNSGKSVFLRVIASICGEENVSNVPLQNLSDEKYVAKLYGKLINIYSELPDKEIIDTATFKSLVSETDKVNARKLFKAPFSFYNKCKLIFATNNLPEIKTSSYKDNLAFFNRLILIPFQVSIPENYQDKNLIYKLLYEKDLIFSWAVDGLIRYIKNGFKFSECHASTSLLNSYMNNSNSMLSFINEMCLLDRNSYVHFDKLVGAYAEYCKNNFLDTTTAKDKRQLKNILKQKYKLIYKRLNRKDGNKYGFEGLRLLENHDDMIYGTMEQNS